MASFGYTSYGFQWGACKIERCVSDNKKGWVILRIITPKEKDGIQVYVTKTGKVRFFSKDGEYILRKKVEKKKNSKKKDKE